MTAFAMTRNAEGPATVLSYEEVVKLLADAYQFCGPKYQVLFATQFFTAGRITEVRLLKVSDIDWKQGKIHFRAANTKTGKARSVMIAEPLEVLLKPWWEEQQKAGAEYLFPGRGDKPMTLMAAAKQLYKLADLRGIRGLSTHSFRRSMATHLRQVRGWSYEEICHITGHQSISSLVRYINIQEAEVMEAFRGGW